MEKSFHDASPDGLIGWELMDDHVHPTLRGQALIAEAIVASLQYLSGPLHVSKDARRRIADWEDYARRCGDNPYDRYGVAHQMRVIFDIGFMRQTNPDAYSRFDELTHRIEPNPTRKFRRCCASGRRPDRTRAANVPCPAW